MSLRLFRAASRSAFALALVFGGLTYSNSSAASTGINTLGAVNSDPAFVESGSQEANAPAPDPGHLLLAAKTVMVYAPMQVVSASGNKINMRWADKAKKALEKELAKWGRFQVIESVSADLIFVIDEDTTESPLTGRQLRERLAIFPGGSLPAADATPLWTTEAKQNAFGLGGRPAGKLVDKLRKDLRALEQAPASAAVPKQE